MQQFKVAEAHRRVQLVATPIGNLSEVSARVREALSEATLALCEDTRVSAALWNGLGLEAPRLVSIVTAGEEKAARLAEDELAAGRSVVVVTDAGYPGLSDPGAYVVNELYALGIAVEVVNGPSSLMHALAASGFAADQFWFLGFLPSRSGERLTALAKLAKTESTVVFFEAPHRIRACLHDLSDMVGVRPVVVARELTKLHETIYRGTASDLSGAVMPKGEIVVVVGPRPVGINLVSLEDAVAEVLAMVADGMRQKPACARVAKTAGLSASEIYAAVEKRKASKQS